MKKFTKLTLTTAFFLAALMTSNVAKAQSVPYFSSDATFEFEFGFNMEIYVDYCVHTAGYTLDAISCNDPNGFVNVAVSYRSMDIEANILLFGLRIFGINIGYTEFSLVVKFIGPNEEVYILERTIRCWVFEIGFGYRMMPAGVTDSQPLSLLSTDSNRLPVIIPQED